MEFISENESATKPVQDGMQEEEVDLATLPFCTPSDVLSNTPLVGDGLLPLEQLLESLPGTLQHEWSSKFEPSMKTVPLEEHPKDYEQFKSCVVINKDPLPHAKQPAVRVFFHNMFMSSFSKCLHYLFATGCKPLHCGSEGSRHIFWDRAQSFRGG